MKSARVWLLMLTLLAPAAPGQSQELADTVVSATWNGGGLRNDAWSLFSNPANLAFLRGAHGSVAAEQAGDGESEGLGVLGGAGSGRGIGFAASSHWLRGPDATSRTFSWGAGFGFRQFAFGLASHDVFSRSTPANLLRRWDTGVSFRLTRHVGVHAVAQGINRVRLEGTAEPTRLSPGLTLQTGDRRVGMDLTWSSALGQQDLAAVRSTLLARLFGGVRVFAGAEVAVLSEAAPWSVQTGLQVSTGPSTAGAAMVLGSDTTAGWIVSADIHTPALAGSDDFNFYLLSVSGQFPELSSNRVPGSSTLTHTDVLVNLEEVAQLPGMQGVIVEVGALSMGPAQLFEFTNALQRIREAGKHVVVYLNAASPRSLYVASTATELYVSPGVATLNTGIGVTATYLATLLDNVGVEAQFVRIGDYKSGPERFTRTGPSDEAREQLDRWLDLVWTEFQRRMRDFAGSDEALASLEQSPVTADALSAMRPDITALWPEEFQNTPQLLEGVRIRATRERPSSALSRDEWWAGNRIAVLHITGGITQGRSRTGLLSNEPTTGCVTIARIARELAADPQIRGVIVRVNSPGGDADASDEILRALVTLADSKPLVVSMGDIAASGGYYVAALQREIVATPVTLTGSIGIYAGSFAINELLETLGVERVNHERGGDSNFFNLDRWDEERLAAMQRLIDNGYARFLNRVADGRQITIEEADALGGGRIYCGTDALEAGLVDSLDGFQGALDRLRDELGLDRTDRLTLEHYGSDRFISVGLGVGGIEAALSRAVPSLLSADSADTSVLVLALRAVLPMSALRWADMVWTPDGTTGTPTVWAHLDWMLDVD
jgi:protease-4